MSPKEQLGLPPEKPKTKITKVDVSTDVDVRPALGGMKVDSLTRHDRHGNRHTRTNVIVPKL